MKEAVIKEFRNRINGIRKSLDELDQHISRVEAAPHDSQEREELTYGMDTPIGDFKYRASIIDFDLPE